MYSLSALIGRRGVRRVPRLAARRSHAPLLEALEDRCLLAAYYVSPTGNDTNNGLSTTTAWRTITRVNQKVFVPGDSVRFQGGATFSGNLQFYDEAGTPSNPITVTSYGTGRATLQAGTGYGIYVWNVGGFSITNLNIVGASMQTNPVSGILFYNTLTTNTELQFFRVSNVDISQFGHFGIYILACRGTSGFNDLRINNAHLHHNRLGGLSSAGPWDCAPTPINAKVIRNLYVGYVDIHDNPGVPPSQLGTSGNGIVFSSLNGAVIERSLLHDNGGVGTGNVGVWVYNSNNVAIQHNEAYRNRTSGIEGGGFDLDFGVTNSIMQYNYAHDNDGQGFYLVGIGPGDPIFSPPPGPGNLTNTGNVVRYNISQRNARGPGCCSGEIVLYGAVRNAEIYNNTVYLTPNSAGNAVAVLFGNFYGDRVNFRNNIIQTTGGARLVSYAGILTGTNVLFQGNNYYSSGAAFTIFFRGQTHTNLTSWRNAGQEKVNNVPVGLSVNPMLTNPGGGGTIGNADQLYTLTAYKLRRESPLGNKGLNLGKFGINPGAQDFFGETIPPSVGHSIGADEA